MLQFTIVMNGGGSSGLISELEEIGVDITFPPPFPPFPTFPYPQSCLSHRM